ncbi:MAG: DNA recombination protein RmuC [Oscillospiraceae bacterium]|nr:DNA recombination protein RmuC [Oscillospiraceae bacterium]
MIYVVLAMTALCAALLTVLLLGQKRRIGDEVHAAVARSMGELGGSVKDMTESGMLALTQVGRTLERGQQRAADYQAEGLRSFEERTGVLLKGQTAVVEKLRDGLTGQIDRMDRELTEDQRQLNETVRERLAVMQTALEQGVRSLREETGRKLDEIRGTVDEKLQTTLEKRITESFRTVSEQLEQVYRGLGEMQTLAEDVGGLKKVLAGVKTRGILGEVQLGAILEEILSPEQYDTNVATVPGSAERVEYAVRLPGRDGTVYLPIDAKFPGERYAQLAEARESGDRNAETEARKALMNVLRAEARDIHEKYVEVPYTTGFGVMFLPFEGLYAEAVNSGLIEELQRDWRISVAGPSTMAALLNSLQMGFRTLAIRKRSGEVWEVLGAVKTEFEKFGDVMVSMQRHLNQTSSDLEDLMGRRTRAIARKLRNVQQLDDDRASELLPEWEEEGP